LNQNMTMVDNHSHIILSDIRSMVASAKAKNIERFSITEHISQFRELREAVAFGATHTKGRIFEDLKEYRDEFSSRRFHGHGNEGQNGT